MCNSVLKSGTFWIQQIWSLSVFRVISTDFSNKNKILLLFTSVCTAEPTAKGSFELEFILHGIVSTRLLTTFQPVTPVQIKARQWSCTSINEGIIWPVEHLLRVMICSSERIQLDFLNSGWICRSCSQKNILYLQIEHIWYAILITHGTPHHYFYSHNSEKKCTLKIMGLILTSRTLGLHRCDRLLWSYSWFARVWN